MYTILYTTPNKNMSMSMSMSMSFNQRRFGGCPSDVNNSFIIFLKTFFSTKRSSSQRLGTQPEFYQNFGTMGRSAGY